MFAKVHLLRVPQSLTAVGLSTVGALFWLSCESFSFESKTLTQICCLVLRVSLAKFLARMGLGSLVFLFQKP
jgi:hypothetical protein